MIRPSRAFLAVLGMMAGLAVYGGGTESLGQGADAQPPSDMATQTLQVYSRLTLVDVTVTNSKGEPVHGLKKEDFTLLEDNKPQPIASFTEYGKETPPVTRMPPKLPPDVYTNLQPAPTTSAVNILLLDSLNTAPADQVFMKQETMKYLKSMPPGTRIAIFGLSSRLRILQGFTTDPEILKAAIDSKKNRALPSPFIDTDTGDTIDSMTEMMDDATAASFQDFENEQAAFQADMRTRMTLEALDQIAAYLNGIKGRKNLIWFSAGMPVQMFSTGGVGDPSNMTDYAKDVRKTADLLIAAQIAVYPVDARGLFNNPANSAVNGGKGFSTGKGDSMAAANAAFLQKTGNEQLGMVAMADATGGVAYYNTNGLKEAVGKAIENGANYYTLSYVPPNPAYDGSYHAITVKVNQKGLKLEYRKGYYADDIANNQITPGLTLATTAPEPYGSNMAASMQRGVPTASQLLFTVKMDPASDTVNPPGMKLQGNLDPKLVDKPLRRYDFAFSMPGEQVTVKDAPLEKCKGEPCHLASLEFDLAAYDVYGKVITTLSQSLDLPLTDDRVKLLKKSPVRVVMAVDLPLGEEFIRVGVLDAVSDKVGTLEIPLTVTKKPAAPATPAPASVPAAAPPAAKPAPSGGIGGE